MSNPTTALERVHVTVCLKDVEIKKIAMLLEYRRKRIRKGSIESRRH
jgi:hypothetical protein